MLRCCWEGWNYYASSAVLVRHAQIIVTKYQDASKVRACFKQLVFYQTTRQSSYLNKWFKLILLIQLEAEGLGSDRFAPSKHIPVNQNIPTDSPRIKVASRPSDVGGGLNPPSHSNREALVWELCPVDSWEVFALRSAILPSGFKLDSTDNETNEKRLLQSKDGFNWKDPQLLFGYSKDSEYKDLGIYFDQGDNVSAVNQVATKAFKMYGIQGQAIDWDHIRGSVLIFRMKPGAFTNLICKGAWHPLPIRFQPLISENELMATLLFFESNNALHVALQRDHYRKEKYRPQPRLDTEAGGREKGYAAGKGLVAGVAGASYKDSKNECNDLKNSDTNTSIYPEIKIDNMTLAPDAAADMHPASKSNLKASVDFEHRSRENRILYHSDSESIPEMVSTEDSESDGGRKRLVYVGGGKRGRVGMDKDQKASDEDMTDKELKDEAKRQKSEMAKQMRRKKREDNEAGRLIFFQLRDAKEVEKKKAEDAAKIAKQQSLEFEADQAAKKAKRVDDQIQVKAGKAKGEIVKVLLGNVINQDAKKTPILSMEQMQSAKLDQKIQKDQLQSVKLKNKLEAKKLQRQPEKPKNKSEREQLQSARLKIKSEVRAAARDARHTAALQRRAGLNAESRRRRNKLLAPAKLASGIDKTRVRKKCTAKKQEVRVSKKKSAAQRQNDKTARDAANVKASALKGRISDRMNQMLLQARLNVVRGKKYKLEHRDEVKKANAWWYQHAGAARKKNRRRRARAEQLNSAGKRLAVNINDLEMMADGAQMRRQDHAAKERSSLPPEKRVPSAHYKANLRRLKKENRENVKMKAARNHNLNQIVRQENLFLRRRDALRRRAMYVKAMRLRERRRAQLKKAMRLLEKPEIIVLKRNKDTAERLMDDITKYNEHRKSIRADEVFWPFDLPWAQTMGHFPHPCLLIHHVHGLGLAQMLHAQNLGHCQFDIFRPLPSAKKYPAMNAAAWKPYKPFAPRNPYPVSCSADARPRSTHTEFTASCTDGHAVVRKSTFVSQVLAAYEFRGGPPGDSVMESMSLMQYIMRYETVELAGAADGDTVPFDQRHPDGFMAAFHAQSLRAVPLTVQAAWTLVETSLGPAPGFPPETPSVTEDWVRGACEFAKYFLAVFRPWREPAIDSADAWAELVCFLRFITNAGSREELNASLAFLADHPLEYAPFKTMQDDETREDDVELMCSDSEEEDADSESDKKLAVKGLRPFSMDSDSDDGGKIGATDEGKETEKGIEGAKSDHNDAERAIPNVSKQRTRMKRSLEAVVAGLGVQLPAAFASMQETADVIEAVLKLTNAPERCLTLLCHQARWSRTMLVDSFVHLPRVLQREVARRLHDSEVPFETGAHVLNRLYGVRVELDLLLTGSDPMDLTAFHSIMDSEDQACNQILAQHDKLVAVAAIYLQLTACTNAALEETVFRIDNDRKRQW